MSWVFTEPGIYTADVRREPARRRDVAPGPAGPGRRSRSPSGVPAAAIGARPCSTAATPTSRPTSTRGRLLVLHDPEGGGEHSQVAYDAADVVIEVPSKAIAEVPAGREFRFMGRAGEQIYQLPQAVLGKHVHGEIDPHLWQNVRNAMAYTELIRDTLIGRDPRGREGLPRRTPTPTSRGSTRSTATCARTIAGDPAGRSATSSRPTTPSATSARPTGSRSPGSSPRTRPRSRRWPTGASSPRRSATCGCPPSSSSPASPNRSSTLREVAEQTGDTGLPDLRRHARRHRPDLRGHDALQRRLAQAVPDMRAVLAVMLLRVCGRRLAVAQDDLEQRIDPEQKVAGGRAVLSDGHVDIGPRFVDGRWTLLVHDDAAKADPAARASGGARSRPFCGSATRQSCRCPTTPAYAFLRAEPGTDVCVVPQTQDPDVVWVGWNTQDPEVMETIDRGVTMTPHRRPGPGQPDRLPAVGRLRRARGPLGLRRRAQARLGRRQHAHPRQLGLLEARACTSRRSRSRPTSWTAGRSPTPAGCASPSARAPRTEEAFASAWRGAAERPQARVAAAEPVEAGGGRRPCSLLIAGALALAVGLRRRCRARARAPSGGRAHERRRSRSSTSRCSSAAGSCSRTLTSRCSAGELVGLVGPNGAGKTTLAASGRSGCSRPSAAASWSAGARRLPGASRSATCPSATSSPGTSRSRSRTW